MSMTKRYLESLPEAEQNAILGEVDADYEPLLSGYAPWEIEEYNREMARFLAGGTEEPEQVYPDAEFEAFWATVEAENKRLADEDDREWAEALATETGGEELC